MSDIKEQIEAAAARTDKLIKRGPWKPHVHTNAEGLHEAWAMRTRPVVGELEGVYVDARVAHFAARDMAAALNRAGGE